MRANWTIPPTLIMQKTNSTMRYHFTFISMAILFKQQQKSRNMTDIEKDVEKLELMFLKKIKPRITI